MQGDRDAKNRIRSTISIATPRTRSIRIQPATMVDRIILAAPSWRAQVTAMQTATPQTCLALSTSSKGSAATTSASWSSNSSTASSLPSDCCCRKTADRKAAVFHYAGRIVPRAGDWMCHSEDEEPDETVDGSGSSSGVDPKNWTGWQVAGQSVRSGWHSRRAHGVSAIREAVLFTVLGPKPNQVVR